MQPSVAQWAAIGAGVVLGVLVLGRNAQRAAGQVIDTAGGIWTGDNAVTRAATNAAGERVTAYEGAGVLGTVGAATNAASGGVLASIGQWLGGKVYDWTNPDPLDAAGGRSVPVPAASAQPSVRQVPQSATWADQSSAGWDYTGFSWPVIIKEGGP